MNTSVKRGPSGPYDWASPRPVADMVKRSLDVVIALAVLVLLGPVWLAIAVLIRLTSPGSALFRRTVIGRHGVPFTYYKFRSMVAGDDTHHLEWLRAYVTRDEPYPGGAYKVSNDSRVTPIGRLLRRTSLDEVPQFINVIRGEMSVVGPRPPLEAEFELYDENARRRLAVRPGITGLYQVTERGRAPFSRMLTLDLEYISRRSLSLDLKIMLKTATEMLRGQ